MKKIYSFLVLAFTCAQIQAQTANAVVFSETGEKFILTLNGEKQNATPQANVKMSGLTAEFYQARVDFEDATLPDFSNNNFAVQKGQEVTYIIKKNKKGEYVLRFQGQSEIGTSASATPVSSSPSTEVKRIADVDDNVLTETIKMDTKITDTGVEHNTGGGANSTVTQTTTTTTTAKPSKTSGENVSMGINMGGVNMGVNINVRDTEGGMDIEEHTATSVTTTSTSKTTTTSTAPAPRAIAKPEPVVAESKGLCASSMTDASFNSAKSNMQSKSFEDSKMTIAKQVTKANCMTALQIKQVMDLFSFEESKLEYAKYAYDFCFNQGDYFQVNDAFTFESSIEELDKFLSTK